jgi:hypothetical protein
MEVCVDKYREMIERCGIPSGDLYDIPTSGAAFPDGAHYRMEISGIDALPEMEALVDEKEKRNVPIHRVICMGPGTHLLTSGELRELAQMGHDAQIEVIVLPGPRANHDIGKHTYSDWGKYSGVNVRGADNIRYFLHDVMRSIEAGIRGFLFYSEDLLWLFHQIRQNNDLPQDLVYKVSYTQGFANPAGAKLLENLGADSLNPITDLTLPMLASLRKVLSITLDIVVVSFEILGVFNRFWESPEIVRVTSPCYLKQELQPNVENARQKVRYCEILREIIGEHAPDLKLSEQGPSDLRIPQP